MPTKAPTRMTSGRGRYVARVRDHRDNVRLATGRMVAAGGLAAAVWAGAPSDVLILVCVLVLFAMWVITDPQRTDQLVKIINALRGPGASPPG